MAPFRKIPVVIEAIQFTGENATEIATFIGNDDPDVQNYPAETLVIQTLEGYMNASIGDWIIRGVKGEMYPCKPDVFELTYESVDTSEVDA
jgi:hypothetical protein